MAPDVELTRLYGKADMESELADIASSYKELIDKAKTEKVHPHKRNPYFKKYA